MLIIKIAVIYQWEWRIKPRCLQSYSNTSQYAFWKNNTNNLTVCRKRKRKGSRRRETDTEAQKRKHRWPTVTILSWALGSLRWYCHKKGIHVGRVKTPSAATSEAADGTLLCGWKEVISAAAAASASTSLTELSLLSVIVGQVERVCSKVSILLVKQNGKERQSIKRWVAVQLCD